LATLLRACWHLVKKVLSQKFGVRLQLNEMATTFQRDTPFIDTYVSGICYLAVQMTIELIALVWQHVPLDSLKADGPLPFSHNKANWSQAKSLRFLRNFNEIN